MLKKTNWLKLISLLALSVLLLTPLRAGQARSNSKRRAVSSGLWGGQGISMNVERGGARIEFDCGAGTIDGPLLLDRRGRFSVRGRHTTGHGGPVRENETPENRPAVYVGRVTGQTMTLTVILTDRRERVGTFTLRLGEEGVLQRCL